MKINYIKVMIKDLGMNEVYLKLPMANKDLETILLKNEITEVGQTSVEHFDSIMKSVINIEIKNFTIKQPTNIYYLNTYLEILKKNNQELPSEPIVITTVKLKEMIAETLGVVNKNMTLEEIYNVINSVVEADDSKQISTRSDNKDGKPLFSIKKLQEIHLERKGK